MQIKNTIQLYGLVTKSFHWAMAILFVMMFVIAYIMINMSRSTLMFSLYDLHKATGLLLFFLVLLRLSWRWLNQKPALPTSLPNWQHWSAKITIFILYFCMFAMPISGFLTSTLGGHRISFYNLFIIHPLAHNNYASDLFSLVHEYIAYLLLIAFALHVAGSLFHHYILKDMILKRIWF